MPQVKLYCNQNILRPEDVLCGSTKHVTVNTPEWQQLQDAGYMETFRLLLMKERPNVLHIKFSSPRTLLGTKNIKARLNMLLHAVVLYVHEVVRGISSHTAL